jgi:hypothetical protein
VTEQKLSEARHQSAHALLRMCKLARRPPACSRQMFAILLLSCLGSASESALVVNLSSNTGPIGYGASGWLYDQAEDGIPTDNMMAPLKPQIAAQKPPDGLQHPAGDAMHVAPSFKRAGGKEIQIYLQDIYPDWPYSEPASRTICRTHPLGRWRSAFQPVAADSGRCL